MEMVLWLFKVTKQLLIPNYSVSNIGLSSEGPFFVYFGKLSKVKHIKCTIKLKFIEVESCLVIHKKFWNENDSDYFNYKFLIYFSSIANNNLHIPKGEVFSYLILLHY
ncbi:hypothetical protein BXY75_2673 [Ulvibacter antarcticus]|uniref:Uncharacterized protein n=1 Tax=Ulvibacter antarcticus TaxID=442714 RepID=A0A3L9YAV1_9FLAO|nr:hypothetical protein BXY75_2673 [Ulvibacter antarcticus]